MEAKTEAIEIVEKVKTETTPLPTKSELRDRGFTTAELESAEKRGMVAKEEIKSEEVKSEEKEKGKEKELLKVEDEKEKFKHSQQFKDAELTPEQESKLRELFPFVNGKMNPSEAIYWRMKNERKSRQKAEAEKRALEEKIKELQSAKPEVAPKVEVDENGEPIDVENKPLTIKQLKELKEKEAKEAEEKQLALQQKGAAVAESLRDQEDYARSQYPDFEDTVKLAGDLMKNLDDYIPDAKTRNRAIALIRDLQVLAAKADELSMEDYNAADISYEIGKLHPNYGKKVELDPKVNGSQKDADKVKRVAETTQRRGSSAGLNGGSGRRIVAPEEVTRDDLAKMDYKQRAAFKKNHPDRYSSLLWG